ncbi:reverse transcriptase, partial [Tanacetum coccineum]
EPPPFFPYVSGETKNNELEQQLITRDDMIKLIRLNLTLIPNKSVASVFSKRRYEKLSPRFFGPYRVKRVVGPVAYELQLPSDARIHPVFHVSMLKPAHSSFDDAAINPLPVTKDWEADLQPDSVISHRWVSEAGNLVLELLISWSNRPVEEATWESYDLLKEQFPNFALRTRHFTGKEVMIQLGYMCIPGNRNESKHMTRT